MAIRTLIRKGVANGDISMLEGIVIASTMIFCHDLFVDEATISRSKFMKSFSAKDHFIKLYGTEAYQRLMSNINEEGVV